MKVIFTEDVKGYGKRGDIKEVSSGYANNILIKKNLALVATKDNIAKVNGQKKSDDKKEENDKKNAINLKNKIDSESMYVNFQGKVGNDGRIFGAINTKQIASELEKQHKLKIDKRKISLNGNIHTIGIHEVPIKLYPGVFATLKVKVSE